MAKPGNGDTAVRVLFDQGETVLLLSCMDSRLLEQTSRELHTRGLPDHFDHVVLAGASLGAVTSRFPHWGRTFYEHLALAKVLHGVSRVILLDHRDCGAYEQVLHLKLSADRERESAVHLAHQQRLRRKIHALDPTLQVDCWLMELDGSIHDLSGEPDLWLPGITERRQAPRKKRGVRAAARGGKKKASRRARTRQ